MHLDSVLEFAHALHCKTLFPGAIAIDATIGNGNDTRFLAEKVGERGCVFGFDIQLAAHQNTRRVLEKAGCREQVRLVLGGHEAMLEHIPLAYHGKVQSIMFNLGYLPGSDKTVITRPETTSIALEHAITLLAEGGLLSIVVYIGHEGGVEELNAVEAWAKSIDSNFYHVVGYRFLNKPHTAPQLILVERR